MFDAATKSEITKIAKRLDVPAAAMMAVAEVESAGKTLARVKGRNEPLIRFEGHYFHRLLKGSARQKAVKAGLAHKSAGRVKNTRSQAARWALLDKAIDINRIAALSSCSWGLGQVMGSHWRWLGYGSVDALVEECRSGVGGQVALMARYIEKAKLVRVLQRQDWAKFARAYNGPAYAKNQYDKKMARAFARFSRENHSSVQLPEVAPYQDDKMLMFGAHGVEVKRLQKQLSKSGYTLVCDGLFGLVTDRVVRQFQRDHRLDETGKIESAERKILDGRGAELANRVKEKSVATTTKPKDAKVKLPSKGNKFGRSIGQALLSIFNRFA